MGFVSYDYNGEFNGVTPQLTVPDTVTTASDSPAAAIAVRNSRRVASSITGWRGEQNGQRRGAGLLGSGTPATAHGVGRCADRGTTAPGLAMPLIAATGATSRDVRRTRYVSRRALGGGQDMPRWAEVAGHSLWFYYHEEHQRPHVAVRGEHRATVALDIGEVLAGRLPPQLHRSIRVFLTEHQVEATAAWEAVRRGEPPSRIPDRR